MKRTALFICLCMLVCACYADEVLSGTVMSGEGWRGLDLGSPYIITSVGWNPKSTTTAELGLFEGANRPDFMDAVPLYIHDGASQVNQMNYASVQCSRGFRYVRYLKSATKGEYKIQALEFRGVAGAGDDSRLSQLTNLPTVVIHTKDNQAPYDKEHEIDCIISVISDDGRTLLCDSATIRERGNASRSFPKKPYRIKFANKHHVLGAPANARKWTLINNYGDKTLMRNALAFELSRKLGMPYTPFCAHVDVVLNGDYKGTYQLCDQIEVRKHRVDITEMTPQDNSGEALTGGYLIEADAYANEEKSMFWSQSGTGVTIKSPKEDSITQAQHDYIASHYSMTEKNRSSYLDLNTFLRHFLVGELSGNTDTYWSLYLYKRRANDTMYVGPVWDFDLAFDNDGRTYPISSLSDYIYRTKGSTTGYLRTLVDQIVVHDTGAKQRLAAIWAEARRAGMTEEALTDYVDAQEEMLYASQKLNFMRWKIMNQYVHQNPCLWGTYENEVNNIRRYIPTRLAWMDAKLGFDAATLGIESPDAVPAAQKILINGQLLIRRNGKVYSPEGRLVTRY